MPARGHEKVWPLALRKVCCTLPEKRARLQWLRHEICAKLRSHCLRELGCCVLVHWPAGAKHSFFVADRARRSQAQPLVSTEARWSQAQLF